MSDMLSKQEMLEIFEQCGGILTGHFLLTSGRHSDKYMQCAKLFEYPALSAKLCSALRDKIGDIKIDAIASPAVGGILMGYEMARQFGVRNIFCERVDDSMTLRRGFGVEQGENILVVEDVITTGGSIKEVITLIQSMGANVVACCSIVDRSDGNVTFDVPYTGLLSLDVKSYNNAECPICKETQTKPYKPGSRKI